MQPRGYCKNSDRRYDNSYNTHGSAGTERVEGEIKLVKPGDKIEIDGIAASVFPAYNINKFRSPGKPFHPKEDGKVGYLLDIGGVKIYHAGDPDFIPEMKNLETDIALLPVSGTYVMTAKEAAEAAKNMRIKLAIPMHYGTIVGSERDAEEFERLAGCEVVILKKEEEIYRYR